MRINQCVGCEDFPCQDVKHENYIIPTIELDADKVSMVMISEAAPENPADYYYAGGEPLFEQTTLLALQDAGVQATSIDDILSMGVYLTSAVKCGKTGYGIKAATIKQCSLILAEELNQFSNVKVYMLMGDVAIKAVNYIAKRHGKERVIPAGSTYKIRGKEYVFGDIRVFPSYLQAGPAFFIEKSKRRMIADDLRQAMGIISLE
jgi:uracil-DNA glycosylase